MKRLNDRLGGWGLGGVGGRKDRPASHPSSLPYLLAIMVLAGACTSERAPEPAADLVAAERAFADASVERGMRAAFLEYLAEDAVIFRPRPVLGRPYFEARPEVAGTLSWAPAFADVAASGDFGYTTGPWTFRADSLEQHGHYVSVWEQRPDSAWRVVIDAGINHPAPGILPEDVDIPEREIPEETPLADAARASARLTLADADAALAALSATDGAAPTFAAVADPAVRVYRPGLLPTQGLDTWPERAAGTLSWRPLGAGVARSGDLGYTYGLAAFTPADGAPPDSSAYLRIWRRHTDGNWMLVLDLASPVPPS